MKIILALKDIALILFLTGLLNACGSDAPLAPSTSKVALDNFKLNKTDIASYKGLKKIPEAINIRGNRMLISFVERNALAEAIAGESWSSKENAEIEIKDKRNQILISTYFSEFMAKLATPDAIDQYYQNNIEKFKDTKLRVAHILLRVHGNHNSEAAAEKFNQLRGR